MRVVPSVGIAIPLVIVSVAASAETFTLKDALAVAYSTNPRLESARARVRAADEVVAQALSGWRPTLNASANYGFQRQVVTATGLADTLQFEPTTVQASLTQPVYSGGQVYAEVQRAKALDKAARSDLVAAEENILLSAATSYLDVVRDAADVGLHQNDVDVLQRQYDAVKTELSAGEVTRTDLDEVEVRIGAAQAQLATADAQLAQSRDAFLRNIGRPAETLEPSPACPLVPRTAEEATAMALRDSPLIRSAQENDSAAQYSVDDAVGALLPHASIVAQLNYAQNALTTGFPFPVKSNNVAVLGQISLPLYQGGSEDAKIRQAKEQRAQSQQGVFDANQAALQSVSDAWSSLEAAQTALAFNERRIGASKDALAGVIEQQHAGERSVIDILNAEEERLQAALALAGSAHDNVVAAYQLLAATGQMTAQKLALKVQIYDPKEHYDEDADRWFGLGD